MKYKEKDTTLNSVDVIDSRINPKWLTRIQAAEYLQCSLCSLDTRYDIKKYYLNKLVRYLKSDLDEYLLAHCKEPVKGRQ
jgi:hypothetical protein